MPKPYDAVTKHLIDSRPADWLVLLGTTGVDAEPIEVDLLDTDLATVTSQADRVLRINSPEPGLQHIELETGHHGSETPRNLLRFSVLLTSKYEQPVESAVILLRPDADSPALTGRLRYLRRNGTAYLTFEYQVLRVWELPVETLLTGGIGTMPLAPLANVKPSQLPEVVRRMQGRIEAEARSGDEEAEFWTSTTILMGLRYTSARTFELLKGVRHMKESATFRDILKQGEDIGRADEARRMLILACESRLGKPSAEAEQKLSSIESVETLEHLMTRLFAVETWDDLLAGI